EALPRARLHWNLACDLLHRRILSLSIGLVMAAWPCRQLVAQQPQPYTWQQIRDKFESANPTLRAAQLNIDESRAAEITANLRPNPDFSLSTDGTQLAR